MYKLTILTITTVLIFLAAGCQTSREGLDALAQRDRIKLSNPESSNYIVKVKDQIKIIVREYPEFDTTATVSENGTIYIKLIGEISAAGLTKAQLTKDLNSKFSQYVKGTTTISLAIANKELQNITIIGAVGHQGVFIPPQDGSLLGAIALAGGATNDSDLRHVKIFHRNDYMHPIEVDVRMTLNTFENMDEQPLPSVGSGDIIYVPKTENFIRELSEFLRDSFVLYSLLSLF